MKTFDYELVKNPEYFKEKMQEYQVCFVKFVQRQKKLCTGSFQP